MHRLIPLSPLLLLAQTLASPLTPQPPQPLPLLIWHGLGDNYLASGLHSVGDLANATNPGTFIYYIRLDDDASSDRTATFLGNLNDQIAQVCTTITNHAVLSRAPAVNALGFSQGGQFLRALIQRCGHAIKVNNLVTFGSQHNGISQYQLCKPGDWLCKSYIGLLKSNTWTPWVQSHLVPAQYFKATNDSAASAGEAEPTQEYLDNSNFLADINNERAAKNASYKANLAALNNFVMYLFANDTTVIPKETGWFAYTNATDGSVTGLRDREIYKQDWIGLRALDEKGALHFEETEGDHMQLGDEVLIDVFEKWFAPPKTAGWTGVVGGKEEEEEEEEVMEL